MHSELKAGKRLPIFRLATSLLLSTAIVSLTPAIAADAQGPGSLDMSFGAATDDGTPPGIVSTSLGDGDDMANDIATAGDGKIVVVGNRNNGKSNDIVIVRYLSLIHI